MPEGEVPLTVQTAETANVFKISGVTLVVVFTVLLAIPKIAC
jgi:hypothetical protein